jgi:hypothetical protein
MGSYYSWRIEKFHQHELYWTEDAELSHLLVCSFASFEKRRQGLSLGI